MPYRPRYRPGPTDSGPRGGRAAGLRGTVTCVNCCSDTWPRATCGGSPTYLFNQARLKPTTRPCHCMS